MEAILSWNKTLERVLGLWNASLVRLTPPFVNISASRRRRGGDAVGHRRPLTVFIARV